MSHQPRGNLLIPSTLGDRATGFLNGFTFDFSPARTEESEDELDVLEDVDVNPNATRDFPWLKS